MIRSGRPWSTESGHLTGVITAKRRSRSVHAGHAALGGDMTALRICMGRILPPRKERPVNFKLPPLKSAEDAAAAMAAITDALAAGELTLSEAAETSAMVERFTRALEAGEFEKRLRALEAAVEKR